MPITLNTSRGRYVLSQAASREDAPDSIVLTLAIERIDGIEKVALRCRIAKELVAGMDEAAIVTRVAQWIEREFEMTRENALKSIRSERKLMEIIFDRGNRGPF